MAIRPDYQTGTIDLVASSADFTTTGSALQMVAVQPGDAIITPSGHVLIIASITGQNSGTLFLPCPPSAAGTGLALRIRFQPDGSRTQGATRSLLETLASGNLEAFAALVGSAGLVPIFTGVGTMDLADPATFGVPDPNGSLESLAALALAARRILQTDASGDLKQVALAANKFLRTDANGDIALSDITAAAIALLNLSGTAAADQLPYLTGASGAGLTALTSFARTILDDANGAAMWSTMGATTVAGNPGYLVFPNGLKIQWGNQALTASSGVCTVAYPTSFTTFAIPVFVNGDTNAYTYTPMGYRSGAVNQFTTFFPGGASATVRITWIAIGV